MRERRTYPFARQHRQFVGGADGQVRVHHHVHCHHKWTAEEEGGRGETAQGAGQEWCRRWVKGQIGAGVVRWKGLLLTRSLTFEHDAAVVAIVDLHLAHP
jgi:hypothetical protein